mgnify:CR=1 FL=1
MSVYDEAGLTPLHHLALGKPRHDVCCINGPYLSSSNVFKLGELYLFHDAAEEVVDPMGCVALFLEAGADINAVSNDGLCALHLCSGTGWLIPIC